MLRNPIIVGLLLSFSMAIRAEVNVVIPSLPPVILGNGTGPYEALILEIIAESGQQVNINYYPVARAITVFERDSNACYAVASKEIAEAFLGSSFIDSGVPYNKGIAVLATSVDMPIIESRSDLEGKRLVALHGEEMSVYGLNEQTFKLYSVDDHHQAVMMLQNGRADALLSFATDVYIYKNLLHWSQDLGLWELDEKFVCHASSPGVEEFLSAIGSATQRMIDSGRVHEILGDLYTLD